MYQYWLLPNWAILMQVYPTRWSEVSDHWLCAILFGTIYVFMSSCLNAQSSSKNICHRTTIALLNIKKIAFMRIRKQNNYSVFQLKTVFATLLTRHVQNMVVSWWPSHRNYIQWVIQNKIYSYCLDLVNSKASTK